MFTYVLNRFSLVDFSLRRQILPALLNFLLLTKDCINVFLAAPPRSGKSLSYLRGSELSDRVEHNEVNSLSYLRGSEPNKAAASGIHISLSYLRGSERYGEMITKFKVSLSYLRGSERITIFVKILNASLSYLRGSEQAFFASIGSL